MKKMNFVKKQTSEDITVLELYDENKSCGLTNGTCNDAGCDITLDVGVFGGCT